MLLKASFILSLGFRFSAFEETEDLAQPRMRTPRGGANRRGAGRGGRSASRRSINRANAASDATDSPSSPATEEVVPDLKEEDIVLEEDTETENVSTSPERLTSLDESMEEVKIESVSKTEETIAEEPVQSEFSEPEELPTNDECQEEEKPEILHEQEQDETPSQVEDEPVEEMTNTDSVSLAVPDASDNGSVENLKKEEEEEFLEEGIPGEEEAVGEERENEDLEEVEEQEGKLGEEEQVEMLDVMKERKKKKEQEIFVGGLDRDATEDDVRKAFEAVGVVEEVRLHKDFATNKNKGFAFVKFAEKEQADKAIAELKNPTINGKRCGIARSEDNDTIFLGNICNTWTKEAIKQRLKDYGIEGLENINLVGDSQNEGLSRGFAFVEFSCHEYAMNAYKRLQKPDVVFGHPEWTAKVAFAEPLREPDPDVMAQVKSVFVDGMPPFWDEDRVKEHFKGYGEIEGIVLARNMPTAKRKDFGFVNFTTHEAAVACSEAVNNTELGDGKVKMKVRARLANPLPKTQAVKGGMRGGFRIGQTGMSGFSRFGGRGFGRGRAPFARGGFQGGRSSMGARGFPFHGHRGGRFPFFPDRNVEAPNFRFRGRQPFVGRGGRGTFRGPYEGPNQEFPPRFDNARSRHGGFGRGRGRHFQLEGDFGGPSAGGQFVEDPYYYGDAGHGIKRPFSVIDDTRYLEPGSRGRPRYNLANPAAGESRYQDRIRPSGNMYSQEFYGPNYGAPGYSSQYGGGGAGGRYYY
ncbi:uncharacterized protein LOC144714847 [Wolffia australiana]